jgi:hypothetical protein
VNTRTGFPQAGIGGRDQPGNTKGGSIAVHLPSCLTFSDQSVLQIKTKIVSFHMTDSKPLKQEVNSTVIIPPSVFPGPTLELIQIIRKLQPLKGS